MHTHEHRDMHTCDTCTYVHVHTHALRVCTLPAFREPWWQWLRGAMPQGHIPCEDSTAATLIGRVFSSGVRTLPGPTEGKRRRDVMSRYDRFGTTGSITAGRWNLPCWVMPAILSHRFHSVGQSPAGNTLRNNCSYIQSVYPQRLCVNTTWLVQGT